MKLKFLIALLAYVPMSIYAQSGKWTLVRQTISASGAGLSTSSTRTLYSSLAESFTGISRNATRILYSGFLFPRAASGQTSVQRLPLAPIGIRLHQNYPNPVTPANGFHTTITYELHKAGNVHLQVYDLLGRSVSVLVDQHQNAGVYLAVFSAVSLPAGAYFVELTVGAETRRVPMSVSADRR
jgi:hypothetical protein